MMKAPRRLPRLIDVLVATVTNRALAWQAVRFAVVGVINTLVDFGVFLFAITFLTSFLVAANVFSWVVAATGSYVMNSLVTFAEESGRRLRLRDYGAFLLSSVAGLVANTTMLLVAADVLLVPVLVAKVMAIGVSFLVNFSLARLVVFRSRRPQPGDAH